MHSLLFLFAPGFLLNLSKSQAYPYSDSRDNFCSCDHDDLFPGRDFCPAPTGNVHIRHFYLSPLLPGCLYYCCLGLIVTGHIGQKRRRTDQAEPALNRHPAKNCGSLYATAKDKCGIKPTGRGNAGQFTGDSRRNGGNGPHGGCGNQ